MSKLVECVPNFSEGRDAAVIRSIVAEIEAVRGVTLLDVDPGEDTNRAVVTFVGPPEAVEAAFRAGKRASETIDMAKHHGSHARMGAMDVCPFVPVAGVTMGDCVALARECGRRIGDLGIPVYLYEHAATSPSRRNLAAVRADEYEGLANKLAQPDWRPDFGPATHNPRSGAYIIGAREFLIAYNVNLATTDKRYADDIAYAARARPSQAQRQRRAFLLQGRDGGVRQGQLPLRRLRSCREDMGSAFGALPRRPRQGPGRPLLGPRLPGGGGRRKARVRGRPLLARQGGRLGGRQVPSRADLHQPDRFQGDAGPCGPGGRARGSRAARHCRHRFRDRWRGPVRRHAGIRPLLPASHAQVHRAPRR
ncbi:MAG: glutamate formimidoyltransferase [Proteobacteria bacterium]|nr:glutamate formimidoyltransferase [Pseudomonadota bacterium]